MATRSRTSAIQYQDFIPKYELKEETGSHVMVLELPQGNHTSSFFFLQFLIEKLDRDAPVRSVQFIILRLQFVFMGLIAKIRIHVNRVIWS